MSKRDIIVIGASAGGIEALQQLTAGLPRNLPASIFVVLHMPSWHVSELPYVISRNGSLPAVRAESGKVFEQGRIYVAPADQHLMLQGNHMLLWRGPKENRYRPAINVLFRSAAVEYRERVAGVVLSGVLDDGSAGLWWIKHYGGVAIVQDPDQAVFGDMPRHALEHVAVDHKLTAPDIGPLLARLADGRLSQTSTEEQS